MKKKLVIILMFIFTMIIGLEVYAFEKEGLNKTLIIYPSSVDKEDDSIKVLDMNVGHFSNDIDFLKSDSVIKNINSYDYVIYYGLKQEVLKEELIKELNEFEGKLIGIGYNVEQINQRFSFAQYGEIESINSIEFNGKKHKLDEEESVINIKGVNSGQIIYTAKSEKEIPCFISNESRDTYYFSFIETNSNLSNYLGEGLFECYNSADKKGPNKISLRLEDINPKTDPDKLMEIAEYLKEKNITYMAVVIPAVKDIEKNEIIHLKDYPKVVNALKYMQDNGGTIVMHGYTHQFRDSETGEGFEFWDSETDAPLENPNGMTETEYIKTKLEDGIEELVVHDLYPVAFEAPHYSISQNGYKVVSEYFSTYVGSVQLSDKTMDATYAPNYLSKPSLFYGMQLVPENLGYVEGDNIENCIEEITNNAKKYNDLSECMLSVFYHPYLGVDNLKILVENLEKNTNLSWFDLRDIDSTVKSSNINIEVKDGEIKVDSPEKPLDYQIETWIQSAYVIFLIILSVCLLVYVFRGRLFKK